MSWRHWWIFRWTWDRNDPRRYGARCNGKTDDTRAIQRWIDAQSTRAERQAHVAPIDLNYPPGDMRRYGAKAISETPDPLPAGLSIDGIVGTITVSGHPPKTEAGVFLGQSPERRP